MNVLSWHEPSFGRLVAGRSRLPHALLFHGRKGTGKLLFARSLAQILLCEATMSSGTACGQCPACGWFASGNHPDFRQIEPDSLAEQGAEGSDGKRKPSLQIRIEQIRDLPDFINMSSHRGRAKVMLIHPAETLNANAANALLKSLEEPPSGTYFLLVAHRVHYLPPTVRSRCQQMALPGPEPEAAREWLKGEGVPDPALALAQTGNSPLLALELAGRDYWKNREFLLGGISERAFDPLSLAEQMRDYPVQDILNWLQKWTFDLIFRKSSGKVRYNPDYEDSLSSLAARIDMVKALRFHRELVRLQRVISHPFNVRLLLEQLLLDYASLLDGAQGQLEAV
jgi:DNA polymerase III subunit delta'